MSHSPISDPEGIQLSPALRQAVSLGDSLEKLAVYLAEHIQAQADHLERLGGLVVADYRNVWGRSGVAMIWGELYWDARFAQRCVAIDPEALPTENLKRRGIVPRIPAVDRLNTQVKRIAAVPRVPGPVSDSPPAYGMPAGLSYADGMRTEFEATISAFAEFDKHFGSFDIWLKQPQWATCESLVEALVNKREVDAEDYLLWFLRSELKIDRSLAPYVAKVLWRGGGWKRGAEFRWRDLDEGELYRRVKGSARSRWYWDVVRDVVRPQKNTISLSQLQTLPKIVWDPGEFLLTAGKFVNLDELKQHQAYHDAEAIKEHRDHGFDYGDIKTEFERVGLAGDELEYAILKKAHGVKQKDIQAYLRLDDRQFQNLRRRTDDQLRKARTRLAARSRQEELNEVYRNAVNR